MTLNLGRDSGVHYRANWSRFSEGWGGWGFSSISRTHRNFDWPCLGWVHWAQHWAQKQNGKIALWGYIYCKTTPTANGPIKRTQRRKCLQKVSYVAVKHIIYIGPILSAHMIYLIVMDHVGLTNVPCKTTFNNDFWPVYTSLLYGLPWGAEEGWL